MRIGMHWKTLGRDTRRTLEMIKFEHSIFALPFAILGALLAAGGWPPWRALGWIVVAMVGARSAAMTFNRIVDRRLDRENPRTRARALAAGTLSVGFAVGFLIVSIVVFELAAWRLNRLCLELSPLALGWVLFYSYTKRFTALAHWVLGIGLGIAPAAAWIAVRGSLAPRILLLTGAVALWVAGFDLLYACQDIDFDRSRPELHSTPKRLGVARSLRLAQVCHLAMLALLVWLLVVSHLGALAWVGVVLVAALLAYEHSLLSPHDLSRMNAAFFTINGYIGILLLVFWGASIVGAQTIPQRALGRGMSYVEETPPNTERFVIRRADGVVHDRENMVVSHVALALYTDAAPHQMIALVGSDDSGKFDFGNKIPDGDYRLIAEYPGLCTANIPLRVQHKGRGRKPLELRMEYPGLDVCSYAR